jgi:hypothetical protein
MMSTLRKIFKTLRVSHLFLKIFLKGREELMTTLILRKKF